MKDTFCFKLVLMILTSTLLASCDWYYKCGCDCYKYELCKIMKYHLKSNGKLLNTRTFCSKYGAFISLEDSVLKYSYESDSVSVKVDNSITVLEVISKLDCDETEMYRQNGYDCKCDK